MSELLYNESNLEPGRDMTHEYRGVPITPNDTLATYSAQIDAGAQPRSAQGLTATGTGNVELVLDAAGNTALITVAVANTIIPVSFIQVKATSTTATGISALFRKGG